MNRIAYMPLNSYPDAVADEAVRAAVGFAAPLGAALHVTTFAVKIPQMASPLARMVLDVPGMIRVAEERSAAHCRRLANLAREAGGTTASKVSEQLVTLGAALRIAAEEARRFDLVLLPWSEESVSARDMAESVVFDSGRPTILVPPSARAEKIDHLAIAWDGSRVAARALGDALGLLTAGGRVTVLTVQDEKPLSGPGLAATLTASLESRGLRAQAADIVLDGRPIAVALQDEARRAGASLLVMGGFGHSRLRDFVLGGATQGVFAELRLPVLVSH